MEEDRSSVERLNDTLYSRTGYVPPSDVRTPVKDEGSPDVEGSWQSPALDDMLKERRTPDPKPTKMKRFFLLSLLFFIGAFVLAAYVYLGGGNFVSTKNVDIQVTGPAAIEAGQPLVLTITVANNNNAELETANLSIQYPEGTRQADDTTLALTRDRADLGIVKAGGENVETFRSVLFGQKGDIKEVKLSLEYKIKGSSATFYKDKTYDITIGDTPVAIGIEKPDSVTSGVPFTTKIIVAANTSDVLQNVIVRAEYPYGFTAQSSSPDPVSADNVWAIGDLSPGDKKTITLQGTMTGVDADERTFRFYAGIADPGNPNVLKDPLVSTTETFTLARPTVGLLISLNGETDAEYVAPMGSTVTANVRYQNNSTEKLTNAHLVVKLSGAALDKLSVKPDPSGFYDSSNNQIVWQAPAAADFSEINPGDSGQVSMTFASLQNLPAGKNQEIDLSASIVGTPGGVASADPIKATADKVVKIASTVNLTGKVLYSRGPFKNTGPLPPKAEATTTYTVVFDLGNTQNQITGGKVTAKLGPNVSWISALSGADAPTFDAPSNTVVWNVGTLASGAGFSGAGREASFQVSLKPSIGQIGTAPTLVSGIAFMGMDSFTNLPVTTTLASLTTRLFLDPAFVQGDDAVVK
ncbi:MAG: protein of unknown function with transrane region [Parcubacteria group bacterium]|nr:protein of unknown function with transrane region [Parcubacteria group bacterium]